MKHLKKFNENNEFKEDLKDICLEFEDMDWSIDMAHYGKSIPSRILKFMGAPKDEYEYDFIIAVNQTKLITRWIDIKDIIYRIKEYMGDRLLGIGIYSDTSSARNINRGTLDLSDDQIVSKVTITYKSL